MGMRVVVQSARRCSSRAVGWKVKTYVNGGCFFSSWDGCLVCMGHVRSSSKRHGSGTCKVQAQMQAAETAGATAQIAVGAGVNSQCSNSTGRCRCRSRRWTSMRSGTAEAEVSSVTSTATYGVPHLSPILPQDVAQALQRLPAEGAIDRNARSVPQHTPQVPPFLSC